MEKVLLCQQCYSRLWIPILQLLTSLPSDCLFLWIAFAGTTLGLFGTRRTDFAAFSAALAATLFALLLARLWICFTPEKYIFF